MRGAYASGCLGFPAVWNGTTQLPIRVQPVGAGFLNRSRQSQLFIMSLAPTALRRRIGAVLKLTFWCPLNDDGRLALPDPCPCTVVIAKPVTQGHPLAPRLQADLPGSVRVVLGDYVGLGIDASILLLVMRVTQRPFLP